MVCSGVLAAPIMAHGSRRMDRTGGGLPSPGVPQLGPPDGYYSLDLDLERATFATNLLTLGPSFKQEIEIFPLPPPPLTNLCLVLPVLVVYRTFFSPLLFGRKSKKIQAPFLSLLYYLPCSPCNICPRSSPVVHVSHLTPCPTSTYPVSCTAILLSQHLLTFFLPSCHQLLSLSPHPPLSIAASVSPPENAIPRLSSLP